MKQIPKWAIWKKCDDECSDGAWTRCAGSWQEQDYQSKIPPKKQEVKRFEKEMRQPRIERGAHRMLHMATMDFTTKPLTL
jgi:hypothetical protein